MMSRCSGRTSYQCIDGSCGYSEYSCKSPSNTQCDHYQFDFLCPDGECAKSDAGCLRPCGTSINNDIYQYPCTGFSTCRASNGHSCPEVCYDPTPYKCANQRCVKNAKYCKACSGGFRCDSGDCTYSYMDKCNEKVDCLDGSDEWESTCKPFSVGSGMSTILPIMVVGVVITLIVVVVVALLIRRRRFARPGTSQPQRGGPQPVVTSGVQPQAVQMGNMPPPMPANPYQPQQGYPSQPVGPYGAPYGPQPGYAYGGAPYQPVAQFPTAPPGVCAPPPTYNEAVKYGHV